jgi:phosphoglycerate dehydrogenase-like enzyme
VRIARGRDVPAAQASPLGAGVIRIAHGRHPRRLTIWCNQSFAEPARTQLTRGVAPHRLIFPPSLTANNLAAGGPDPLLAEADVAFGQPDPTQVTQLARLRWVQLTTAGYTRYDTEAVRAALRARGAILTNSSSVYEEPCAEHALAMMLSLARRLPHCLLDQRRQPGSWNAADHRIRSHLLEGQSVLILGYGTIAKRLVELLGPLRMKITCVRRAPRGDEGVPTVPLEQVDAHLPHADHVMNIMPQNAQSDRFFDARRLALIKPRATFYNIGRGTTVDQTALVESLRSGHLAAAYLDVTDPEPLPADHPLWTLPNCFITPHTAGGSADEFERLARHFLDNLARFSKAEPLHDRVM